MTTNPTPLTAEDAEYQNMKKQKEAIEAKQGVCLTGVTHSIYDQIVDEQGKRDEECLLEDIDNKLLEFAEAYAAQQNTELVAEMKEQSHYVETLEAENERLKQAAALFREASFQGHSSHWDSQGTNGANCPACLKASSLRLQAYDLLPQSPKEAT